MTDWILLAVLVMIWTALLIPARPRRGRATRGDFSVFTEAERRVLMPRDRLLGSQARARSRARERRRRVLTALLEGIGLTALMGFVPPLRAMWVATGVLLAVLALYVWLLLRMRVEWATRGEVAAPPEPATMPPPEFPVVGERGGRPIVVVQHPRRRRAG